MANFAQPGPYNPFVPTFAGGDATDGLIVGFSRNINDFAVNSYSQIVPVAVSAGKYLAIATQQFIRFPYSGGQGNQWAPGADRPTGQWNTVPFSFLPYETARRDYPFILDQKSVDQAQFGLQQIHVQEVAVQAMTDRTQAAVSCLNNATWGTNQAYVDPANSTLGGNAALLTGFQNGSNWSNGTPTQPNIKISLQAIALAILKATQGVVTMKDLKLVIGPDSAFKMSQSPEIQAAFIQSQFAEQQTTGMGKIAANWGLPPSLYGMEVMVEQSYVDTSNLNTTLSGTADTVTTIIPSGYAYVVSRPGGLMGVDGAQNWSSLVGFFYEEFTSEQFNDPINRRIQGHVTTDFQYQLTSNAVAFQVQKIFSV